VDSEDIGDSVCLIEKRLEPGGVMLRQFLPGLDGMILKILSVLHYVVMVAVRHQDMVHS
jgi:hypothetical protein